MQNGTLPGVVNGPIVGMVCKEIVRRAIEVIHLKKMAFDITRKADKGGKADFLTSADRAAQEIYYKKLSECFPGYGMVGEEDELSVPCRIEGMGEWGLFFTFDPLDGTKAFMRRQSHGIGTMLSLVSDEEVAAAFVGDVMTRELYYYRPDSPKVHRLYDFGQAEDLTVDPGRKLRDQYVLLRERPEMCSRMIQLMVNRELFREVEVSGGSIGTACARLWKGEVGAFLLMPGAVTPWDFCPVLGLSKKLGFVFCEIDDDRGIKRVEILPRSVTYMQEHELLIVHESRLGEIEAWLKAQS